MKKYFKIISFLSRLILVILLSTFAFFGCDGGGGSTTTVNTPDNPDVNQNLSITLNVSKGTSVYNIELSWTNNEEFDYFEVYRSESSDGTYNYIGSTSSLLFKDKTATIDQI